MLDVGRSWWGGGRGPFLCPERRTYHPDHQTPIIHHPKSKIQYPISNIHHPNLSRRCPCATRSSSWPCRAVALTSSPRTPSRLSRVVSSTWSTTDRAAGRTPWAGRSCWKPSGPFPPTASGRCSGRTTRTNSPMARSSSLTRARCSCSDTMPTSIPSVSSVGGEAVRENSSTRVFAVWATRSRSSRGAVRLWSS